MHSGHSGGVPPVGCTACWLWQDCSPGVGVGVGVCVQGSVHVPCAQCALGWGRSPGPAVRAAAALGRAGRWGGQNAVPLLLEGILCLNGFLIDFAVDSALYVLDAILSVCCTKLLTPL